MRRQRWWRSDCDGYADHNSVGDQLTDQLEPARRWFNHMCTAERYNRRTESAFRSPDRPLNVRLGRGAGGHIASTGSWLG